MKKTSYITMIMGTMGGILFSFGMCMVLLLEWNIFTPGIVTGSIGLLILIITLFIWRKLEGKPPIRFNKKIFLTVFPGIAGVLLLGFGMSLTMVWSHFIIGIVIGITGIVLLLALIPITRGLR
jgi:hypothetical protein